MSCIIYVFICIDAGIISSVQIFLPLLLLLLFYSLPPTHPPPLPLFLRLFCIVFKIFRLSSDLDSASPTPLTLLLSLGYVPNISFHKENQTKKTCRGI
ncbi:hypothetical protein F4809DRAFT_376124 [Biscogniauxia mediterranea]|nr:hypothetical protein F4809DRAFT_376124 [Biscogniauxia mediterranea]